MSPLTRTRAELSPRATHVPGESGIWVLVLGDMVMFSIFFAAFLVTRGAHRAEFAASRTQLDLNIGIVNTLLLLTSSLLVAVGVGFLRRDQRVLAARVFLGAGACAFGFASLKVLEYSRELSHGITPGTNDFFMYFYVLTGVHLAHLVIGTVILLFMWKSARRSAGGPREHMFIECGATYWHMVDLLWIVLFPLLYLVSTP